MSEKNQKQYYSVREAADLLGVSRIAVFKKIQKGQLSAEKVGHDYIILAKDLNELLQEVESGILTEQKKEDISKAVEKVVKEYGDTLKLLGKE